MILTTTLYVAPKCCRSLSPPRARHGLTALDPRPLKHGSKAQCQGSSAEHYSTQFLILWWCTLVHVALAPALARTGTCTVPWWYRHRHRSVVFTGISLRFRAGCTPVVGLRVRVIHGKDNLCDPSQDNLCDPTVSKPLGHPSHNARTHLDCHWCRDGSRGFLLRVHPIVQTLRPALLLTCM